MTSLQDRTVLVTGASGMMGRAVSKALAADNHVIGAARFTDKAVREELDKAGVECLPFDLGGDSWPALPEAIDTLIHLAVCWPDLEQPAVAYEINAYRLARLLRLLPGLEQFVIGSTAAVYVGAGQRYDLSEASPLVPSGLYGASKLAGDVLASAFARERQVPGAILRYWFPYTDDPGEQRSYYNSLLKQLSAGEPFVVPEDRPGCQQPIFVDDVAAITIGAFEHVTTEPFVVNVAGPERLALADIFAIMGEVFGLEPHLEQGASPTVLSGSYDLGRLESTIGHGRVTFREGMQRLKLRWEA